GVVSPSPPRPPQALRSRSPLGQRAWSDSEDRLALTHEGRKLLIYKAHQHEAQEWLGALARIAVAACAGHVLPRVLPSVVEGDHMVHRPTGAAAVGARIQGEVPVVGILAEALAPLRLARPLSGLHL